MSMRKHGWRCPRCNRKPAEKRTCEHCGYDRLEPKRELARKVGKE